MKIPKILLFLNTSAETARANSYHGFGSQRVFSIWRMLWSHLNHVDKALSSKDKNADVALWEMQFLSCWARGDHELCVEQGTWELKRRGLKDPQAGGIIEAWEEIQQFIPSKDILPIEAEWSEEKRNLVLESYSDAAFRMLAYITGSLVADPSNSDIFGLFLKWKSRFVILKLLTQEEVTEFAHDAEKQIIQDQAEEDMSIEIPKSAESTVGLHSPIAAQA